MSLTRFSATSIIGEAASRLGFELEVLDEYGYLFALRNGARERVLLGGRSALNNAVSSRLAEDKHYSSVLLLRAGLRVPRTMRCLSPTHPSLHRYRDRAGLADGLTLAAELGYPLVVKPNRLSHGRGVELVEDEAQLVEAIEAAWALDAIALVQETIGGRDFRLDFLDGEYLLGYERRPLAIVGDGRTTIAELLGALDVRFLEEASLERLRRLPRFVAALGGRTLDSVLDEGAAFAVEGPIQNLNAGSTAAFIPQIPDALRDHCVRAADALGLRHFGVDLKLEALDAAPESAVFIEINASPLLTQIARIGHAEEAIAAQTRVLRALLGEDA